MMVTLPEPDLTETFAGVEDNPVYRLLMRYGDRRPHRFPTYTAESWFPFTAAIFNDLATFPINSRDYAIALWAYRARLPGARKKQTILRTCVILVLLACMGLALHSRTQLPVSIWVEISILFLNLIFVAMLIILFTYGFYLSATGSYFTTLDQLLFGSYPRPLALLANSRIKNYFRVLAANQLPYSLAWLIGGTIFLLMCLVHYSMLVPFYFVAAGLVAMAGGSRQADEMQLHAIKHSEEFIDLFCAKIDMLLENRCNGV